MARRGRGRWMAPRIGTTRSARFDSSERIYSRTTSVVRAYGRRGAFVRALVVERREKRASAGGVVGIPAASSRRITGGIFGDCAVPMDALGTAGILRGLAGRRGHLQRPRNRTAIARKRAAYFCRRSNLG